MDYNHQVTLKQSIDWYMNQCFTVTRIRPGQKILTETDHFIPNYDDAVSWVEQGGNLGFYPGKQILVIDVDRKNGVDGKPAFDRLNLPATRTIRTPSGGMHFYFSLPEGAPPISQNVTGCSGIDFLSNNHNVVIPGSVVRNGATSGCYELVVDRPVAQAPDHLLDLFKDNGLAQSSEHEYMPLERVKSLCEDLRNDDLPYGTWFNVIAAIHYETQGSADGMRTAEAWSMKSGKHTDKRFEKSWNSLRRDRGDNVATGATLVQMVRAQAPRFEDVSDVPVKQAPAAPPVPPLEHIAPARYKESRLPGIAGIIEEWADERAMFDTPELNRAVALLFISMMSRNRFTVGGTDAALNLYILAVAGTGKGKEAARQSLMALLNEHLPDEVDNTGTTPITNSTCVERVASGPGLSNMLTRRKDRLWLPDEFGLYLSATEKQGSNEKDVIAAFLGAVSRARGQMGAIQYSRSERSADPVNKPFLSALATTNPETMAKAMEGALFVENGMINRSVPVVCSPQGSRRRQVDTQKPNPLQINLWRTELARFESTADTPHRIPLTPEADDYLWKFALWCDRQEEEALWVRSYENALKLSGLVALGALSDGAPLEVTLPIAEWAVGAVKEGISQFRDMLKENMGRDRSTEQKWKRVLSAIEELQSEPKGKVYPGSKAEEAFAAGYVRRTDLFDLLGLKAQGGKALLDDLEAQGKLMHVQAKNFPKRPAVWIVGISGEGDAIWDDG